MALLDGYIISLVGGHDILIFGKSPVKWRQRPEMTLAVDSDADMLCSNYTILIKIVNLVFFPPRFLE